MLTRKNFNKYVNEFISDIKRNGLRPSRLILFGSYAKGTVHSTSDIDLAMWADSFTGSNLEDSLIFQSTLSRFPLIQIHCYKTGQSENDDPFLEDITKTGKELSLEIVDVSFD
jgi:predicted nucleotidyltransferase